MSRALAAGAGAAAILAAGLAVASCQAQLTPQTLLETYQNIQDARRDLTPENEYYIGRSLATKLLARYDYAYHDKEAIFAGELTGLTHYVNMVGAVVAGAAMEIEAKDDRPAPLAGWNFVVIEDGTINGVAAPGGYVFITEGAVRAAQTEDELAALLAHEIAHLRRGHAIGSIRQSRWAGVTKQALDSTVTLDEKALGELTEVFDNALDDMLDSLLVKGYSRDTEFEADEIAIEILARAGYEPHAFISYLETLDATQDTGSGGFSSTHPSARDRIAKLERHLETRPARAIPEARTARFLRETRALRDPAVATRRAAARP
jgi:beta-barrel assembly-enhancing protease